MRRWRDLSSGSRRPQCRVEVGLQCDGRMADREDFGEVGQPGRCVVEREEDPGDEDDREHENFQEPPARIRNCRWASSPPDPGPPRPMRMAATGQRPRSRWRAFLDAHRYPPPQQVAWRPRIFRRFTARRQRVIDLDFATAREAERSWTSFGQESGHPVRTRRSLSGRRTPKILEPVDPAGKA